MKKYMKGEFLMKTTINVKNNEEDDELKQYFTDEELESASKELEYMEKHLDEYKSYDNVTELFNDLDSD